MEENKEVSNYISIAPGEQKTIMEKIRRIIFESVPKVKESFKWSRPIFSTEKDFAYLQKTKNHVSLGFFNAEKLEDKGNRLEGTGKSMRHIKLKSKDDIDEKLLRNWFKQST